MTNEITHASMQTGGIQLAAQLFQELRLTLADRAYLWGHPALTALGSINGAGSDTMEIPFASLDGVNEMSAIAETGGSPANTALTSTSPTISVARQYLQRQISDLGAITDAVGINVERLALDMVGAAAARFTTMVCAEGDGFTTVVGTSGVNMSVDDFYDAQFALIAASVPGDWLCVLAPQQVADFQSSLRSEGGANQYIPATAEMLNIKGQGYQGAFNGIDIFRSDRVQATGGNSKGFMFGTGAIGYLTGSPTAIRGAGEVVYPAGSPIVVEFERDAGNALTKIVGNFYCGVGILEDARGVVISTDE